MELWTNPNGSPSLVPAARCYNGNVQGMETGAPVNGSTYNFGDVTSNAGVITWVVPGGGFYNGPGSGYLNGGDNFIIFQSPDTHDGRRGNNTMTLMNDMVRPDDGGFWGVGSLNVRNGSYDLVTNASYPTGNQGTITDTVIWLGRSPSGYHNYTWTKLVTFKQTPTNRGGSHDYGVRVVGVITSPDPANSQQWTGVWNWTEFDGPGGYGGDGLRGAGPAKIDFSQEGVPGVGVQLCLGFKNLDSSPYPGDKFDYYCYHEGDVVDQRPVDPLTGQPALPSRALTDFVGFRRVTTTTGGAHAEVWWQSEGTQQGPLWCDDASNRALLGYTAGPNPVFGGSYTAQENCSLDRSFCGSYLTDPALYRNNRNQLQSGTPDYLSYQEWSTKLVLAHGIRLPPQQRPHRALQLDERLAFGQRRPRPQLCRRRTVRLE